MTDHQTIDCKAAVITPPGEGGIGVIQVSGPDAHDVVDQIFRSKHPDPLAQPGRLYYGHIVKDNEVLDEVLVAVLDNQGEEIAEINCHGGIVAVERVMQALQDRGARRISAQQAVSQGLNTIQREAALLLPRAHSRQAVRMLLQQYAGELGTAISRAIASPAADAAENLVALRDTARTAIALCQPSKIVIAGAPNVGKSTLFNALLGHSRAIVTDIPGTTRDFISDTIALGGFPFKAIDTAGLRESDDIVEQEGVRLSHQKMKEAEVILFLFDATTGVTGTDRQILEQLQGAPAPVLKVANKIDLLNGKHHNDADAAVSAETGAGIKELETMIVDRAIGGVNYFDGPAVFTNRQLKAVDAALSAAQKNEDFFREILYEMLVSTEV